MYGGRMGWGRESFCFRCRTAALARGLGTIVVSAPPVSLPFAYLADRVCVPSCFMVGLTVVMCAESRRPPLRLPLPPAVPAPFWRLG